MSRFELSLAEWSVHRRIQSGDLSNLDFPRFAQEEFGIRTVELVNTLMEGPEDHLVRQLEQRVRDAGSRIHLIMCDDEGDLSAIDRGERRAAIENHLKWLEAACVLGCRAVRVNTGGEGQPLDGDAVRRCAESCRALVERARPLGLGVLVENHGGLSSRVDRILELVEAVGDPAFGTLPDFGNFPAGVDRYDAVERLLPHAGAVSVKCLDFDSTTGDETTFDLARMLDLVLQSDYHGTLGIEYEGERLGEIDGIHHARRFLERWARNRGLALG